MLSSRCSQTIRFHGQGFNHTFSLRVTKWSKPWQNTIRFLPLQYWEICLSQGQMISVHLWNFLSAFIPKCFMQNPQKSFSPNAPSVVDLELPCRFIWRPGDRISAAPAILNMRPCRCVNGVTVWGNELPAIHSKCSDILQTLVRHFWWCHPIYTNESHANGTKLSYFSIINLVIVRCRVTWRCSDAIKFGMKSLSVIAQNWFTESGASWCRRLNAKSSNTYVVNCIYGRVTCGAKRKYPFFFFKWK